MKQCFKCGETKPVDDFYRHKHMADGRLGKCKECTKRDVRENRRASERAREYDRRRYHENPKRRAYIATVAKRWAEKYPDRRKAQWALNNALRDKRTTRPETCEECGAEAKLHAHHEDYSQPLDVRWLCVKCHQRHHHAVSE